mmetsp:Transcript_11224/g.24178  ORF Transcript_11224/g.24178 Transcript_11224/m.24178 type:complete len:481 (+) Transcript_11224:55-1497(+)
MLSSSCFHRSGLIQHRSNSPLGALVAQPALNCAAPGVRIHGQQSSSACKHQASTHLLRGPALSSWSTRTGGRIVGVQGQASETLNLPYDIDLEQPLPGFDSIKDALADLAAGKFLVVLDDENRENEGDLIIAADKATTEAMAFMVEYTSGVICIGMEGRDLDRLRLPLMVSSAENEEAMYTAFTVTVDLRDGITTGISAADRANTIRKLADPSARPEEFRRPGHIFPLRYRPGGVIVRPGHTEASVDLSRLAGCSPAGVLCEIVNKSDGSMSRTPELLQFAKEHGLKCITIADLIRYRLRHEQLVSHTSVAQLPTRHGMLTAHTFTSAIDGTEHVCFTAGELQGRESVLAHVHHESMVADLLGCAPTSNSPSTGTSLDSALQRISAEGHGVVIYLRNQAHKSAESSGKAAIDLCDYALAAQMLSALGAKSIRLASNTPEQMQALRSCGVKVEALVSPLWTSFAANGSAHHKQLPAMHSSR